MLKMLPLLFLISSSILASDLVKKVEVKLSLDTKDLSHSLERLGVKEEENEDIYFIDDKKLSFKKDDILLRLRLSEDPDFTVKQRPVDPNFPWYEWTGTEGLKCEDDQTITKTTTSCSLSQDLTSSVAKLFLNRKKNADTLFSKDQKKIFEKFGRKIIWSELLPIGPIKSKSWKIKSKQVSEKITVELWTLPSGIQFLEVSCKAKLADGPKVFKELKKFISNLELSLSTRPTSKTDFAFKELAFP